MSGYKGHHPLDLLSTHWLDVPTDTIESRERLDFPDRLNSADNYSTPLEAQNRRSRKISCKSCHDWKVECVGRTETNPTCDNCLRTSKICGPYVLKRPRISACEPCRSSKVRCSEGEPEGPCQTCVNHERTCTYSKTVSGSKGAGGNDVDASGDGDTERMRGGASMKAAKRSTRRQYQKAGLLMRTS